MKFPLNEFTKESVSERVNVLLIMNVGGKGGSPGGEGNDGGM